MFLVETYVTVSHVNGVGLYTKYKITPGTVVACWDPLVDRTFDQQTFKQFPDVVQKYIRKHGTRDKNSNWKLGFDGDQYINHSERPNLIRREDKLIAERVINAGTELTCDYRPYRNDI